MLYFTPNEVLNVWNMTLKCKDFLSLCKSINKVARLAMKQSRY